MACCPLALCLLVLRYHRAMTIEHRFARLSEVELHYARAGEGDLVLFLHGFPEFWYAWHRQLTFFSATHLAVAPDLRGFNLSSKPPDVADYTEDHLVTDVRELVHHLGRERCSIVGHDWGGFVACYFAHRHPEMLERLVLINACNPTQWWRGFASVPAQVSASQYIRMLRSPQAEEIVALDGYGPFFESAFLNATDTLALDATDRAKYIESWSRTGGLTGGINYYRALPFGPPESGTVLGAEVDPLITRFTVETPTRIIWGDRDIYLIRELLTIEPDLFADVDIRYVEGASHWVIHERPDAVNALIAGFLGGG